MSQAQLHQFYQTLCQEAETAGIRVSITGGHACIHYQIALFTKDCDVAISSAATQKFLEVLNQSSYQGTPASYRFGISAPLASPWSDAGWTSHFEYPGTNKNRPRIDVFVQPPRLNPRFAPSALFLSRDALAETKKTQREKDWEFVTGLGVQLLRAGEPRGYLHVFDAEEFLYFKPKVAIPDELCTIRPNLGLYPEDIDLIETAFDFEKRFWMKLDAHRVRLYREASRDYFRLVSKKRKRLPPVVMEQHQILLDCAEAVLVPDPVCDFGRRKLVGTVRDSLLSTYPPEFSRFLPNLEAVIHEDGIYNPGMLD